MRISKALLVLVGVSAVILSVSYWKSARQPPSQADVFQSESQILGAPQNIAEAAAASPVSSTIRAAQMPRRDSAMKDKEREALQRSQMANLDSRLHQQSVDAKWAMAQEATIRSAIVGLPNDGFDLIEPDHVETDCRTDFCRIRMDFSDEEMAVQMQAKFTMGLKGAVATARTFYVPRHDGGMDLVIYAGKNDRLF